MRGFPIDQEVNAQNLLTILDADSNSPNNKLRRLRLWAQFQLKQIPRPEGATADPARNEAARAFASRAEVAEEPSPEPTPDPIVPEQIETPAPTP